MYSSGAIQKPKKIVIAGYASNNIRKLRQLRKQSKDSKQNWFHDSPIP